MLARHGIRPDKSLGQHFLVSDRVVRDIVARVEGFPSVLEVGPGPGVLTAPLCAAGHTVTVVEVDEGILPVLAETAPCAQVVHASALDTDLGALLRSLPSPRGLVSNMPYNITGPLLEAFTDCRAHWSRAVLMMQAEVAEKILAKAGDSARGALSVALQALFDIERVCKAPPGAFWPPPKVESLVLQFTPRQSDDEPLVQRAIGLARAGFRQPRKTLLNNLSAHLGPEAARDLLNAKEFDPRLRPHQLTEEQWLTLAR